MKSCLNLKNRITLLATKELAKRDAWEYCLYHDYNFFSKRPFLKVVAHAFQWVLQKEETPQHVIQSVKKEIELNNYFYKGGNLHKIAISMPPRSGKSYTISICCAWAIGRYPSESIMRNACTERLYQKFSYDVRDIVRNDKFKNVFDVELSRDKHAVSGWNTTESKQVGYFGAGVGGTIIGFGASKLAITDDLYKSMMDALSENTIEKVSKWKESAHDTRLERNCPEIDIGTRWSKKDILGTTEEKGEYDLIIRIQALDKNNKSFCEDVKTTEEYLAIKTKLQPFMWVSMYQQAPIEVHGLLFPPDKLQRFSLSEFNKENAISRLGIVDLADEGTDLFALPILYKCDTKWYLVDAYYSDDGLEVTKPESLAIIEKHKLDYVKVETNSQGKDYYRFLKANLTNTSARGVFSVKEKETRILMQAAWIIENVYFRNDYEPNSQYALFIEHLTSYLKMVKNQKDDPADSMAAAAQFIKKLFGVT
jgi:predicted phage terminase large subunit-like protein